MDLSFRITDIEKRAHLTPHGCSLLVDSDLYWGRSLFSILLFPSRSTKHNTVTGKDKGQQARNDTFSSDPKENA
jgi:hypothetical protein